jgi:hypothetical protein
VKWGTVAIVAGLAFGAYWLFGRNRAAAGAPGGQRQYTPAEKRAALDYLNRVRTDPFFRAGQSAANLVRAEVVADTAGADARVDTTNVGDRIAAAMKV